MDQAFTKVLENSAAFIEEYTLEQDCFTNLSDYRNAPIHPLPPAFHRFPNLMLLRINTLGNEFSRRQALNPIPAVTMALDRLSQSNDESKLEEFEILFDFSTEGESASRGDSPLVQFHRTMDGLEGLSELDKTLCHSAFRRVKRVVLTFDFTGCGMPEDHWRLDRVWDSLFTRMEKTHDRGMLTLRMLVCLLSLPATLQRADCWNFSRGI
jgi:hypothetical protein